MNSLSARQNQFDPGKCLGITHRENIIKYRRANPKGAGTVILGPILAQEWKRGLPLE